ncbi:hypothetical protein LCGC14_0948460 [marine sediment metagenome]|uniref:Phage portal protein n=1 Tax=marine sediment metagenome TaxID=412755 RepID=A0A0F9NI26_9ZZZZ
MPPSLVSFKERPVINSNFLPSASTPAPRSFDLNTLMYWIKRTPECIGILRRISNDIVTPISFTAVESEKKLGRPPANQQQEKIDKAVFFAQDNNFHTKEQALVIDWAATGDDYAYKSINLDEEVKEIARKYYKEFDLDIEIKTKELLDEDYNGLSSIEIVPSTMVRIKHDATKILKYVQRDKMNPGREREFNPDEIIHHKYMDIDGSVYGYSPMEAGYTSIRTVNAIQDYGWYYFENGAKIDRVWMYKGTPNKEYWEKFQEDVAQYISVKKAHGHLFAAGAEEIKSEKLNEITEEMEYRQLAIHSVGRLAFSFNMPADMLSSILGKDIKPTAGSSDVEDAGYYRNIERAQEYRENLWNTQLWIPHFGVRMHYQRIFKQDQIRQIQYMGQAIPVIQFLQNNKFPLKDEYYYNILQLDKSFLKEGTIEWAPDEIPAPVLLPDSKGPKRQALSDKKREQQKVQERNNPPLGKERFVYELKEGK